MLPHSNLSTACACGIGSRDLTRNGNVPAEVALEVMAGRTRCRDINEEFFHGGFRGAEGSTFIGKSACSSSGGTFDDVIMHAPNHGTQQQLLAKCNSALRSADASQALLHRSALRPMQTWNTKLQAMAPGAKGSRCQACPLRTQQVFPRPENIS